MLLSALLVEDDADLCKLIRLILRKYVDSVEVVADGPSAIAMLERSRYDLIILDIMLPGANGFEVTSCISRLARPPKLIVVSALARYFTDRFPEGTPVLQKPFDVRQLERAIGSLLSPAGGVTTLGA